jgi:hypothetical protein
MRHGVRCEVVREAQALTGPDAVSIVLDPDATGGKAA